MTKFKLRYFNIEGRGEPIRWILKIANQEFEDETFTFEEWPAIKPDVPYGKVPILYVDGQPLGQTIAICRYLGRRFHFWCDDPWQQAVGDEIVSAIHDMVPGFAKVFFARKAGKTEEAASLLSEFMKGQFKTTMDVIEPKLKNSKWICGDKMTWVDITSACFLSLIIGLEPNAFETYPLTNKFIEEVKSLPQLKK